MGVLIKAHNETMNKTFNMLLNEMLGGGAMGNVLFLGKCGVITSSCNIARKVIPYLSVFNMNDT